jgi:parallel beta-helix repeat protein
MLVVGNVITANAATIVVTTNASFGPGSLYAAIVQANSNGQPDTIIFPATYTLSQVVPLPAVTENGTTIDGSGSSFVSIDGNTLEMFSTALVNDFTLRSVQVSNSQYGVHIRGGQNNRVLNCSFSTSTFPVYIHGNATTSQVRGCTVSNNDNGMYIVNSTNSIVGGTTAAERNRFSANDTHGLFIQGSAAQNNVIIGNWFGLNALGTLAEPNLFYGIRISGAQNNTIGGTTSAERNVISGNFINGIQIDNANSAGNVIIGNYIGTDRFGSAPVPNTIAGISLTTGAHDNRVGGTSLGEFNLIRYNLWGVTVNGATTIENSIRRNAIFNNSGPGINLSSGGNTDLASPVITMAAPLSGTVPANGTVDLYIDADGEGEIWIDSVSTIAGSFFSAFDMSLFEGEYATATLTDDNGNTSRFSVPFLVDVTPPTGSIAIADSVTVDPVISLDLTAMDNFSSLAEIEMRFSNSNGTTWSPWEVFASTKSWDLNEGVSTPEDGIRTVVVEYRDTALNISLPYDASIELDTTGPEVTAFEALDPSPTDAAEVHYSISFSEPVANLETGSVPPFDDFLVVAEVAKEITGAEVIAVDDEGGNTYTVTVSTGTGEGLLHLELLDTGGLTDDHGNPYVGTEVAASYVIDRLAITQSPQSGAETEEFPYTFTVQTTGGLGTLVYTWYKDGLVIPDASGDTYVISELVLSDAGTYWVDVTDDYLTVTSDEADLQVIPEVPVSTTLTLLILALALGGAGAVIQRGRRYTRISGK